MAEWSSTNEWPAFDEAIQQEIKARIYTIGAPISKATNSSVTPTAKRDPTPPDSERHRDSDPAKLLFNATNALRENAVR